MEGIELNFLNLFLFLAIAALSILFTIEYFEKDRNPFQTLYRIYEFCFDRWSYQILEEGEEMETLGPCTAVWVKYTRYLLTNKFNGKQKEIIKYSR